MTATARISRVAVAVTLGVTAPLALRAEAAPAASVELAATGAHLASAESAPPGPARRAGQPVADTSVRREHGRNEHAPATAKRRTPKARSGSATSAQPTPSGGQYVPDQPWETEFLVSNWDVAPRSRFFRLVSTSGN